MQRRKFLRTIGRAALVGPMASALPRPRRRVSPNERIGIGLIGVGGLGYGHHLRKCSKLPDLEVRAVADVDRRHRERAAAGSHGTIQAYRDYRHVLDRADIDAVLIATPDHWHRLTFVHACQAGKDVYCEKPLSLTIAEGRAMSDAAKRYGRVVQVGTQQRSTGQFHQACELVRNGRIGTVRKVEVCLGRGPTSKWVADSLPPDELDWDFWLGPAPWHPYNEKRCHGSFRWFFDYSGGKLTDWGAHHLDIVQWGLGTELSGPISVEAKGEFPDDNFYETPTDFDVEYRYADGVAVHATGTGENGVTFQGTNGAIFVSRRRIAATPNELLTGERGPIRLKESSDHHLDWIDCMRTRAVPVSDVESGHRSATVCHLGNLAMRLGRKLRWDPLAERFIDDESANRLLAKPMRGAWELRA